MSPAQLRALLEPLDPAGTVTVRWLLERLDPAFGAPMSTLAQAEVAGLPPADLDVADLAARVKRHPSTCRAWLESGRIPGAYLDASRRWRVPVAALLEFEAAERAGRTQPRPSPSRPRKALTLNAWRTAS